MRAASAANLQGNTSPQKTSALLPQDRGKPMQQHTRTEHIPASRAVSGRRPAPVRRILAIVLHRPETPSLLFLVILIAVLATTTRGFFSLANLVAILDQVAVVAIIALALNLVIISGEIDVSVGAVVGVCCYVYT